MIFTRSLDQLGAVLSQFRKSQFIQQIVETYTSRLFEIGVAFVTSIIIVRALGVEGRGVLAGATAVTALIAQIGNLGLHTSNTFFYGRDPKNLNSLVGNSIFVSMAFGFLVFALYFLSLAVEVKIDALPQKMILVALALAPFHLAFIFSQNLLIATNEVRRANVFELASAIVSLVAVIVLLALGLLSPFNVYLALSIGLVACTILGYRHLISFSTNWPRLCFKSLASHLPQGMRVYVAALCSFLVIRIDVLMLTELSGVYEVGLYSVAASLGDMIYMLPVVASTLLFSRLSKIQDIRQRWRLTQRTVAGVSVFVGVIWITTFFAGEFFITRVYGVDFRESYFSLVILLPGLFFLGLQILYSSFLVSLGFPGVATFAWVAACLVNVVLNLIAIPAYQARGAAGVSSFCYILVFVLIYGLCKVQLKKSAVLNSALRHPESSDSK